MSNIPVIDNAKSLNDLVRQLEQWRQTLLTILSFPPLAATKGVQITLAFEVAEVFEVPLHFLMNPHHHETRTLQSEQGQRRFYAMPYQNKFIWGATAGMLRNLYHFLRA